MGFMNNYNDILSSTHPFRNEDLLPQVIWSSSLSHHAMIGITGSLVEVSEFYTRQFLRKELVVKHHNIGKILTIVFCLMGENVGTN